MSLGESEIKGHTQEGWGPLVVVGFFLLIT
jgi:hypothetical protein